MDVHTIIELDNIIEKYKSMIYGIALTHTKRREDADDIFQEVFLAYFSKKRYFNDEEHRKAWLIRTTVNQCGNVARSSWNKKVISLNEDENIIDERLFEFALEEENDIYSALCGISDKYRMVLYLYYFEDLSIKEISHYLKVKESAAKMRLSRGREMIREKLKGGYFNEE